MVGLLTALPRTPLYERLKSEGRLIEQAVERCLSTGAPRAVEAALASSGQPEVKQACPVGRRHASRW